MWSLLEYGYDLIYFLFKNIDNVKWEALIGYSLYLFGKRSGMKMFRKFLQGHFPLLADENEEWRRWATNQIELLGGRKWQPKKLYMHTKRSVRVDQKNLTISSTLLQPVTDQGRQYKMAKKKLVIDPGHGGHDSGAVSITGVNEKAINLTTALKVKELLKNNPNIDLLLTRKTDVFIELGDRVKKAAKFKADALISIHVNSFEPTSAGTETEYSRDECIPLAKILQKYLVQATGFKDRSIHKQSIQVIRETTMPAALAEPGFLSNPKEETVLITPVFADRYAEAVARAACEFLGVPYEVTPAGTYPVDIIIAGFDEPFPGLLIEGRSWVPARDVLNALGAQWSYALRKIYIGDTAVETKNFSGLSYIKSIELQTLGVAKVFLDPDAVNTKRVLLFPKEVV